MARAMTVENLRAHTDVIRALTEVASESTLRQAAVAGARVIHTEAVLRAPMGEKAHERSGTSYPPGTLKQALLIAYDQVNSVTGLRATYLITWGKQAFYGRFLEHGSSHQPAIPFLRPSYDATRDSAAAAAMRVFDEKVAEAQRK